MTFVGGALAFTEEAVAQVAPAVVAAHLALGTQSHVGFARLAVKAHAVGIPPDGSLAGVLVLVSSGVRLYRYVQQ